MPFVYSVNDHGFIMAQSYINGYNIALNVNAPLKGAAVCEDCRSSVDGLARECAEVSSVLIYAAARDAFSASPAAFSFSGVSVTSGLLRSTVHNNN